MTEWPLWFDKTGAPISEREAFNLKYGPDGKVSEYGRIGEDTVGGQRVSTVWLALDHRFFPGPPELFETMIFGGPFDSECVRYSTEEQAIAGHAATVAALRAGKVPAWIESGEHG